MNRPDILGIEVETPDGRGLITTLHYTRVTVTLNRIGPGQAMKGVRRGAMNYSYPYQDVHAVEQGTK